MKDIFKTISASVFGLFSSLYAGVEHLRMSIIEIFCSNATAIVTLISQVIAAGISVLTGVYIYYKIKSLVFDYHAKIKGQTNETQNITDEDKETN